MHRILFPGSFDPLTVGHFDLLERASRLCDELIVAVLHNPKKQGALSPEGRAALVETAADSLPSVRVITSDALLVEVAKQQQVRVIVRGLRAAEDAAVEIQMAQLNRSLEPGLEILLLATAPQYAYISASFVREIASKGGDISAFVPASILAAVQSAYA